MSVYIFIPKKKKKVFSRWYLLLGVLAFILVIVLIEDIDFGWKDYLISILKILALLFLALYVRLVFKSLNEYEDLNGYLCGKLILKKDEILIGEKEYGINSILEIKIKAEDYYGLFNYILVDTPDPKLSIGVNNSFEIKFKDGSHEKVKFKQFYKDELVKKNREVLIHYHLMGKISFLALIQLFRIEDYDEIQKFKSSLK